MTITEYFPKKISLSALIIFAFTSCQPNTTNEQTIDSLLSQMTIAEKVGQITQIDHRFLDDHSDITDYSIGSLLSGGGSHPKENTLKAWVDLYNGYQEKALASRLGIPLIYGIDAVHGHNNVKGATIFPHNIGLGATGNADIVRLVSEATSSEVAATGINWTFAPCIASPQDYRWGRTYEGFSSDPNQVLELGVAAVEGYQSANKKNPRKVIGCAKHFIGDGNTIFGTGIKNLVDRGNTIMTRETLKKTLIPAYQAAVDAGVQTVMASYNSWNGVKCHGSKELLTDILKEEMGFEGFVISDWQGIDEIPGDYKSDIVNSINAGMDMVMVSGEGEPYKKFMALLTEAIEEELIPMSRIDDAVARILKVKLEAGLFDEPLMDYEYLSDIGSEKHREIGRDAVRQSVVVLKNESILPLSNSNEEVRWSKIVVAGKGADNLGMQCGGWTIQWQGGQGDITEGTTILEGLVENSPPGIEIIHDPLANKVKGDVAIIVIGEDPYTEFFGDRDSLNLNKEDLQVIENAKAQGMKVVVLLISGRPMNIANHINDWDAFAAIWLPGTEGAGISDVLYGSYNPTGRLSFPWPVQAEEGASSSSLIYNMGEGLSYE
tara:strand:- start:11671 stop:13485 length:1815 start_codon:yes stop_codon:yes gene_type:complete